MKKEKRGGMTSAKQRKNRVGSRERRNTSEGNWKNLGENGKGKSANLGKLLVRKNRDEEDDDCSFPNPDSSTP